MAQFCRAEQVAIWAYCLMPNHVHLIVVPQSAKSLRRAIGEAHRWYTRWINFREGWRGHVWQGRFASFVMDEDHHLTAARYVELNPVHRIGPGTKPLSLEQHGGYLRGRDDSLVQVAPLLQIAPNWRHLLTSAIREDELKALRAHERTGRPLGDKNFLALLEQNLGRILRRQKPGPKNVQARRVCGPGKPTGSWHQTSEMIQEHMKIMEPQRSLSEKLRQPGGGGRSYNNSRAGSSIAPRVSSGEAS